MKTAVPKPRQLEYQDWEMGMFLHFGIRTFYEGHRDWDGKPMSPAAFNPAAFDADNWVLAAKNAGMKYIVLTAKHHDGFANWPSRYTDFSVASSPWRGGKGDVIREFVAACRRHGIKPGLYYSPADASSPVYSDEKAYDDYFINQISELLAPYGEIDVLWFDGCGSAGHKYDWSRITGEIRRMQPNILIFNMGDPDFRWVGNEAGLAPVPIWNTVDRVQVAIDTARDEKVADDAPLWLPAECDCRMRLRNWFYSDQDEHTVKSVEELMGLYYYSVGRGCNLLLNIGPDRRGLLPDKDAARLIEFGEEIRRRFGSPFARLNDFKQPEPNTWDYSAEEHFLVDHVVIQEDLAEGERARRFKIEVFPGRDPVTLWEGRNIGHKAICPFPLTAARKLRVQITECDGPVSLRYLELHNVAKA
ncbi:MAG: alpha-L-fucosidase [Planctomycetota bacterium]